MVEGGASPPWRVGIQRRLRKICASNRDLSKCEKHDRALLHCQGKRHQLVLRPLLSGQAVTIRAERLERLTVCYSWECPSSVLAGTDPSPRSSVPGTTSLPLRKGKNLALQTRRGRKPTGQATSQPRALLGTGGTSSSPRRDEAQDGAEEMPRALQDRMGVTSADSSSIPGKARGT